MVESPTAALLNGAPMPPAPACWRLVVLAAGLLIIPAGASAQRSGTTDTARARVDTLREAAKASTADTARSRIDTVEAVTSPSGIDTVVTYSSADSIVYAMDSRTMHLFGKGQIAYRELGLKAERININWNTSVLTAEGVPDTSDTSNTHLRGIPDLIDGSETYHGTTVAYNFRTRKGKIDLGKTEIEKGYYYGDEIKKMNENVLFVADGRYTTCDLPHPHYFFASPEMKIVVGERVVARPIVLEIADVPVFALPFGIFPTARGRRSGLIAPAYGESNRGRYLAHLGYYWAISDYMDWNVRADGYTKGGYTLYSDYRYALRYTFSGEINGSYGKFITGERGDPGYANERVFNLHMAHNQEFDPTTRLAVDFSFMSGSYFERTSTNLNDLLTQNVISNATLSKYWEGTPNSLTLNLHRDQNLRAQPGNLEVGEILPNINFTRGQSFPFRSSKRGVSSTPSAWYELIGYTYSGTFLNTRNRYLLDTLGNRRTDEHRGLQHSVAVNASPKLGYVTFTPFFNYTEKWYDRSIDRGLGPGDSTIATTVVKAFKAVRYYDMGLSASTKFYGIFQPRIFGIKGIRHQVTPSVSYTYQPDFSQPRFGYFGTYRDTSGRSVQYSRYEQEVFGGAPAGERQAISLNIGNVFEMKTASTDTSGQDNKFQLLNLGVGISYNFAADSLRFSELGMDFRTSIGQYLSIGGGSRWNLYKFEPDPRNPAAGRRVNRFLLDDGGFAQLTAFSISIGTHLSGERKQTTAGPVRTEADSLGRVARRGFVGLYDQEAPDFSIPWNLDLSWNFSQNQADPRYKFRSSTMSASLGFNLTEFWKISATANYDVLNRVFAAPQITVYRDLHCWEMNFSWVPTGPWRNYRIEIRLKAPQLQDVKVTKQESARGVYQ